MMQTPEPDPNWIRFPQPDIIAALAVLAFWEARYR
jgi:hypothetical protein